MFDIFKSRQLPITVRDYPDHPVDVSLFDTGHFDEMKRDGIILSPVQIIHAASIHYQGKFRKGKLLRLANAYLDILHNIEPVMDEKLKLKNTESSEFKTKSTEVIAVGICVAAAERLFRINRNRISVIETSKKRCDFEFVKEQNVYTIESKGRQRKEDVDFAIRSIFKQKDGYAGPKYGFVSCLPRDGQRAELSIVDPDFVEFQISRIDLIKRLLRYYSKLSYLAGFYLLGGALEYRASQLVEEEDLVRLDKRSLDLSVAKLGTSLVLRVGEHGWNFFIPRGREYGFRVEFENYRFQFGISEHLIELLISQDFLGIENYRQEFSESFTSLETPISVASDGSALIFSNMLE